MAQDSASSLDLSVSAQLIEDAIDFADLPTPQLGEGDLAAFWNGVFVANGDKVLLIERDAASPTGWSHVSIDNIPLPQTANGGEIVKLLAFEVQGTPTTVLNLICLFPAPDGCLAASWMCRINPWSGNDGSKGSWEPAKVTTAARSLISQVKQIAVAECGVDRGMMVHGITNEIFGDPANSTAFAISPDNYPDIVQSAWDVKASTSRANLPASGASTGIALLATPSGAGPTSAAEVMLLCYDDTSVWTAPVGTDMAFPPDGSAYRQTALRGPGVAQLVGIPLDRWSPALPSGQHEWQAFLVDGGGALSRVEVFGDGAVEFTSLLVSTIAKPFPSTVTHFALASHGGLRSGFAVDGTGALWTIRDVTSSTPIWAALGSQISGGGNAKAVACPPASPQALQVYYASGTGSGVTVRHASQMTFGGLWHDQLVTVASPPPVPPMTPTYRHVSTVTMEIAVTLNGTPVPHSRIAVTSDMLVTLIVRGNGTGETTCWVGDGDVPIFTTDAAGRARVRFWAKSLGFPRLEFVASSDAVPLGMTAAPGPSESRACRGDVVEGYEPPRSSVANRLSGDGDASKADPFSLTTTALTTKQQTGTAKKPRVATYSLLPPDTTAADGDHVVDLLHHIGTFMKSKSPSYGTQLEDGPGLARTWTLKTDGTGILSVSSSGGELGSAWDDFTDFASDALHFVAHCADAAAEWTIHVATDALHFAVGAFKCAIKTAEEAGALVTTIFHSIQKAVADVETFVREVIAFFEMLFAWDDILRTHDVFLAISSFALSAACTSKIKDGADSYIGQLKGRVDTWLEKKLEPTTSSASGLADSASHQPRTIYSPKAAVHLQQHSSRCHYVLSHAKGHDLSRKSASHTKVDPDGKLNTSLNSAGNHQAALSLKQNVNDSGSAHRVFSDAPSQELVDIFVSLVNAALDGVEDVVDVIIGLLQAVAEELTVALKHHIDIPFVTWLYSEIGAGQLTLLNLFCLIAAVPATILYKLVTEELHPFDGKAPFDKTTVDAVTALFAFKDDVSLKANMQAFQAGLPAASKVRLSAVDRRDAPVPAAPRQLAADAAIPLLGADQAPLAVRDLAGTLGVMSATMGLFASAIGLYLDYKAIEQAQISPPPPPDPLTKDLSWVSTALGLLSTFLLVPITTWAAPDQNAETEVWTNIYWLTQFGPGITDAVSLFTEGTKIEMVPEFGPMAESLLGMVVASAGAVYCFEGGPSDWDIANVVLTCIPRPFRILLATIAPDTPDTPAIAAVVLTVVGVTDTVGLAGGVITGIGSAYHDNV